VGFRRVTIPYRRAPRRHGESAWTFGRKLRYLLDSVFSFSDLPIRLLKWSGALTMTAALVFGAAVFHRKLSGEIPVPGYAATVLTIMFFGGFNSLGLGVLGEYVWRTFENTKGRPLAIVRSTQSFEAKR
jgi:polyisoprenyl-phosphate glycosyltransferase